MTLVETIDAVEALLGRRVTEHETEIVVRLRAAEKSVEDIVAILGAPARDERPTADRTFRYEAVGNRVRPIP